MPRQPRTFRQSDIAKAVKGAEAAGLNVIRVEVGKDGKIVVVAGNPEIAQHGAGTVNEWDEAA
jgi:hypothetical protein